MLDINQYMDLLISTSISTAKMEGMIVNSHSGKQYIRPQLNTMLVGDFGTGKSTILYEVSRYLDNLKKEQKIDIPHLITNDLTFPGLFATIDKNGLARLGALWKVPEGVLLVDEMDSLPRNTRDLLLPLLQSGEGSRLLGFHVYQTIRKRRRRGGISFLFKDGYIHVKGRFSVIAATMSRFGIRKKDKALLSRFAIVQLEPSLDVALNKKLGLIKHNFFYVDMPRVVEWPFDLYVETVKLAYKEAQRLMETYGSEKNVAGLFGRTIDNFLKAATIYSYYRYNEINPEVKNYVYPLFTTLLINNLLTMEGDYEFHEKDWDIMELFAEGKKVVEIAEVLGVSKQYVSKRLNVLMKTGMLTKTVMEELFKHEKL